MPNQVSMQQGELRAFSLAATRTRKSCGKREGERYDATVNGEPRISYATLTRFHRS